MLLLTLAWIMAFVDETNQATANGIVAGFVVVYVLVALALLAFSIWIYWRIATKAGYQGALSLLMLIPLVNLIILLIFAFTEWPIETELKSLRGSGARPVTT